MITYLHHGNVNFNKFLNVYSHLLNLFRELVTVHRSSEFKTALLVALLSIIPDVLSCTYKCKFPIHLFNELKKNKFKECMHFKCNSFVPNTNFQFQKVLHKYTQLG